MRPYSYYIIQKNIFSGKEFLDAAKPRPFFYLFKKYFLVIFSPAVKINGMNKRTGQNIISDKSLPEDRKMDKALRPQQLSEFVGQEKMKEGLKIFIRATQQRGQALDHTLFHGGPGLGKTTIAHIIARELGVNIKVTSGPALEKIGDLAAILTNLEEKDVLFIDEIHRISKTIEEVLYPALEDYALDLILGRGPSAKTLRLDLPSFTLIGATTKPNLLSSPLRDRFGLTYQLKFYSTPEIQQIVLRSADILGVNIDQTGAREIAKRSRFTPRIANRLLKRVRDFAQVENKNRIDADIVIKALSLLEIDQLGLQQTDRKIIRTIIDKFSGGPVGLRTLAISTGLDLGTLEEMYEPYLIQTGLLKRTTQGRKVTPAAYEHLKYKKKLL